MKIIKIIGLCFLFTCIAFGQNAINENEDEDNETEAVQTETVQHEEQMIAFSYKNEDIINIINSLAALKDVNVILPQAANAINAKVTLHLDKKLTVNEAWDLLVTLLDTAGFSIVPNNAMITIVKKTKDIVREPMPVYIGTDPNDLPATEQQIRYIYYLANIKATDDSEINTVLRDILSDTAVIKTDPNTNGILIVAKSHEIRAAMKIVTQLDTVGFQEKIDIMPLRHTSAEIVARLLNEQILVVEGVNPYRLDTKKTKEAPYFSKFTKVIPEERTNKLIILGRTQAVDRLKEFIRDHIDTEPDSGESILHVHKLQYLDSEQFAPVLQRIVESSRIGGPGQARSGDKVIGGIERFFDEVLIRTDKPAEAEELKYYGGNKLVIAARNEDWRQIKKLIEELDTPQPQVLIEVLIADLSIDDTRLLGALTRTPDKISLPSDVEFQSAHLTQPIPDTFPAGATPSPNTIHSDVLRNAFDSSGDLSNNGTNNAADFANSGSTLLSLSDNNGRTWSILQILQLFNHSKILSHPHVMAMNNKKAEVVIGEERLLADEASGSLGGSSVRTFKPIRAELRVEITPRISAGNTINLTIEVNINEFIPGPQSGNAQTIRKLKTNANIKSGGVFALGGLIRVDTDSSISETPILSSVPILGWFFKKRQANLVKNNLTVFISPTIIEPRLRRGIGTYTQDYIDVSKEYVQESTLFDSLRDPITRWFFTTHTDSIKEVEEFISKDEMIKMPEPVAQKKEEKKNTSSKTKSPQSEHANDNATINLNGFLKQGPPLSENKSGELRDLKKLLENDTEKNPFLRT